MSSDGVCVIIPMHNIENSISGVLCSANSHPYSCCINYILVDMGSSDGTVPAALGAIKKLEINARVIQCGVSSMTTALNTGIRKSSSKYITFLFPKRLYKGFIDSYYHIAELSGSDVIISSCGKSSKKTAKKNCSNICGEDLLIDVIGAKMVPDIGCILIKKSFLLENNILFSENCTSGYCEEFIMKIMLYSNSISCSSSQVLRDVENEAQKTKIANNGVSCFDKVESIIRIYEIIKLNHKKNKKLFGVFKDQKIPETIISCIENLLANGTGYGSIVGMLKLKKYNSLLKAGRYTSYKLRRKILIWKTTPWMYKLK